MLTTSPSQADFDRKYISTTEIMRVLDVSRTAVFAARKTGKLPDAICVWGQIYVWERERIHEYLHAWRVMLDARRAMVGRKQDAARGLMSA